MENRFWMSCSISRNCFNLIGNHLVTDEVIVSIQYIDTAPRSSLEISHQFYHQPTGIIQPHHHGTRAVPPSDWCPKIDDLWKLLPHHTDQNSWMPMVLCWTGEWCGSSPQWFSRLIISGKCFYFDLCELLIEARLTAPPLRSNDILTSD
jgi:hypothetical protein